MSFKRIPPFRTVTPTKMNFRFHSPFLFHFFCLSGKTFSRSLVLTRILLLSSLFFWTACAGALQEEAVQASPPSLDFLLPVQETRYTGKGKLLYRIQKQYDIQGRLIQEKTSYPSPALNRITTISYDKEGTRSTSRTRDAQNRLLSYTLSEFDPKTGNILKRTLYTPAGNPIELLRWNYDPSDSGKLLSTYAEYYSAQTKEKLYSYVTPAGSDGREEFTYTVNEGYEGSSATRSRHETMLRKDPRDRELYREEKVEYDKKGAVLLTARSEFNPDRVQKTGELSEPSRNYRVSFSSSRFNGKTEKIRFLDDNGEVREYISVVYRPFLSLFPRLRLPPASADPVSVPSAGQSLQSPPAPNKVPSSSQNKAKEQTAPPPGKQNKTKNK